MSFVETNGVKLYVRVEGSGHPLLLLHGFTGSAESWRALAPTFANRLRVIAVDLLGHGRSDAPHEPSRYSMESAVDDLLALLDQLQAPQATLLGYSMGGRLALHVAMKAPERVSELILESATYGIDSAAGRAERRHSDGELAAWIEAHGVEAFARRWASNPLFATQAALPEEVRRAQERERLMHAPVGLANSLRGMGTGAQASLHAGLATLGVPTLLIAGELDPKFATIAQEMHALLPNSELALAPEAGHNVHLERPETFEQLVTHFLTQRLEKGY